MVMHRFLAWMVAWCFIYWVFNFISVVLWVRRSGSRLWPFYAFSIRDCLRGDAHSCFSYCSFFWFLDRGFVKPFIGQLPWQDGFYFPDLGTLAVESFADGSHLHGLNRVLVVIGYPCCRSSLLFGFFKNLWFLIVSGLVLQLFVSFCGPLWLHYWAWIWFVAIGGL